MRFRVERRSGTKALGPPDPPCEGAVQGTYVSEHGPAQPGWFIDLDAVPDELGGLPVEFTETDEPGSDGHLLILD